MPHIGRNALCKKKVTCFASLLMGNAVFYTRNVEKEQLLVHTPLPQKWS